MLLNGLRVQNMSPTLRKTPDLKALRRIYQTNPLARRFFDQLASRKNNSRESTVDRLRQVLAQDGPEASRREVIALLQSLEPMGTGDFVVGRRGQPSRFCWAVGMVGLAKAARGDSDGLIESIDDVEVVGELDDERSSGTPAPAGFIAHAYQLRPDTRLTLSLPSNLTPREAARLAEFIKTLPFSETNESAMTSH